MDKIKPILDFGWRMTLPPKARWCNPTTRKYGNKKVELDGYVWDSIREKEYYQELKLRKLGGDIKKFIVKPTFWIAITKNSVGQFCIGVWQERPPKQVNDGILFRYTPDFLVDDELVDVKGKATEAFRIKARTMAALGLPVRIVK